MKKKDLDFFKKILLSAKEEVLKQLVFDKEQFRDLSKKEIGDVVDKAFYLYEKNKAIELLEKEKKRLESIDFALLRIDKSAYGKCFRCGKEIDRKRLEIVPWATMCV